MTRRDLLKGGGVLIVGFVLGGASSAVTAIGTAKPNKLELGPYGPPEDQLDSWLEITADGRVTLFSGCSELGTGSSTALSQIVAEELRDGNLVCIFPEGRLTSDGEIGDFRAGMMRILKETPVPVVPLALSGLWDSMFSRKYPAIWQRWPRRFWPKISLRAGPAVAADEADLPSLRERVVALRGVRP